MDSLGGLLFPLLILLLFVPIFLSGRKQRRQMQEMQQLQSSLDTGDVVTTTSGLRGTVVDASYEETVDLEIADGVVTTWLRAAVRDRVLDSAPDADPTDAAPATAAAGSTATGSTATGSTATGSTAAGSTAAGSDGATYDGVAAPPAGARTEPVESTGDANGTTRP